MKGYFFDIRGEWENMIPLLNNHHFIKSLNIYNWWNFIIQNNNTSPLIRINKDDISEDELYVIGKLFDADNQNPYWYCVPHECVNLNPLITGTLASLYTQQPVFYLSLMPQGTHDVHVVVCNKQLSRGDIINLTRKDGLLINASHQDAINNDVLIIYDIIYPLMSFFGYSWFDRTMKLDTLVVCQCTTLEDEWKSMGYMSYKK